LHDLAVIVRGDRVVAAGVQLPLADPSEMPDPMLGSRHRAAVGLSKETDALVLVVSEETGAMRISERGRLSRAFQEDELAEELRRRLRVKAEPGEPRGVDDPVDEENRDPVTGAPEVDQKSEKTA
jgi:diadenylate cyclase